ncbi:hypothetical protein ACQ4PT_007505 [Festuca glaucescens]
MAAGQAPRHPTRLFVVAKDPSVLGNLVFNLNLKHLFSQKSQFQPHPQPGDECQPPPLLSLPDPLACFIAHDYMAFAASPSGDIIAAIGANGRTQLYDGAAVSPGPDMRSSMNYPFLVPVGDHMFIAISSYPRFDVHQGPRFEALHKLRRPGGGGRWAWTAVPEPPGLARRDRADVTAYFVSGARVYVSLRRQGTYSYDTARRRWRTEGAWELPVLGRALLVPNFLGTGRRLLFGFRYLDVLPFNEGYPFCAVDMDASPPVIVGSWPDAACFSEVWRAGYNICSPVSQLNYFGGGRFCISVTSHSTQPERARQGVVSFMAVELTQDLQLLKRQYSCYLMPESSRCTYADDGGGFVALAPGKTWQIMVKSGYKLLSDANFAAAPTDGKCWKPPPGELIKFNVDVAFDAVSMSGAAGVVCHSDRGGKNIWHPAVADPLHGEALACRECHCFTKDQGFEKLLLLELECWC